jgi:hypothetical protein
MIKTDSTCESGVAELMTAIAKGRVSLIHGHTGLGITTELPVALQKEPFNPVIFACATRLGAEVARNEAAKHNGASKTVRFLIDLLHSTPLSFS